MLPGTSTFTVSHQQKVERCQSYRITSEWPARSQFTPTKLPSHYLGHRKLNYTKLQQHLQQTTGVRVSTQTVQNRSQATHLAYCTPYVVLLHTWLTAYLMLFCYTPGSLHTLCCSANDVRHPLLSKVSRYCELTKSNAEM